MTVEVLVEGDKFNVVALALGSCAFVLLTWGFGGSAGGGGRVSRLRERLGCIRGRVGVGASQYVG